MNNSENSSQLLTKISAVIKEEVRRIDLSDVASNIKYSNNLLALAYKLTKNQLSFLNHDKNKSFQLEDIFVKYRDSDTQKIDKLINITNLLNEHNSDLYEYNESTNIMQFIEISFILLIIFFIIFLKIYH